MMAETGRCAEIMDDRLVGIPLGCSLSSGHAGQHHDDVTGADWSAGFARQQHQIPLLRLDLAQVLRDLVSYHGDRPWSGEDFVTAANVVALVVEARVDHS